MKRGDLVRLRPNGKGRVYVIRAIIEGCALLDADADHPDAATRVPDAFRSYRPDELHPVDDVKVAVR